MKEQRNFEFSVAMSIYYNDSPAYVQEAFNSIVKQTVLPKEIVIVFDGTVKEEVVSYLDGQRHSLKGKINVIIIRLEKNMGLGAALGVAAKRCSCDWIARMDSDDIASPDRFERQIKHVMKHPEIDVLGGQIAEFVTAPEHISGYRIVPVTNGEIRHFLKKRCPMNHVTVLMKRESLMKAGNYRPWPYNEDYFLWIRMSLNGCVFENLNQVLVFVRVGDEMYRRRGGKLYYQSEKAIQKLLRNKKIIGPFQYMENVFLRFFVQLMLPDCLRGTFFKCFARVRRSR